MEKSKWDDVTEDLMWWLFFACFAAVLGAAFGFAAELGRKPIARK